MDLTDDVISSPLCYAAREGNVEAVRRLLGKGHNPRLNDNRGWTPLHEAVDSGHVECARVLLEYEGCNINARTFEGTTPLFMACSRGNSLSLIELLLESRAHCNIGSSEEVTPLHVACKYYHLDVIKKLIEYGAHPNKRDFNGFTPLLEAIDQVSTVDRNERKTCLDVIRFLLDHGADISLGDDYGRRPFFLAVSNKWEDCVKLLLDYGANVNDCTVDGTTALTIAAQCGDLLMVKFLLHVGAKPEVVSHSGTMPLHHALHNGYTSVAEELLKKMDLDGVLGKRFGETESFLILAIDSSCYESYKFVMKYKIYSNNDYINVSSSSRNTLLSNSYFLHYQRQSPVSFLLLHHLEQPHSLLMLKDLLNTDLYGANPKTKNDVPPLVALIAGSFESNDHERINHVKNECFYILLDKGANVDYCSSFECMGIPDCVLAVVLPWTCATNQSLLVPVLGQCFSRTWDELLEWLVKKQMVNAYVFKVLLQLSSKTRNELQEMWRVAKRCSCKTCTADYPNVQDIMDHKTGTLKSVCRTPVRHWLGQQRMKSCSRVKDILDKLAIPREIKEFIVPACL